uniref:Uncharacterized protein n=1 Tax=viral metagenome TaxID=1070528 RepID=A0A6M3M533_9ZZZZ
MLNVIAYLIATYSHELAWTLIVFCVLLLCLVARWGRHGPE